MLECSSRRGRRKPLGQGRLDMDTKSLALIKTVVNTSYTYPIRPKVEEPTFQLLLHENIREFTQSTLERHI